VLAALAAVASAQQTSWETLETMDVDNVLKNTKLVKRYLDCLLDRGRCEKNGRDWKGKKKNFNSKLTVKF
jgi:hypothetical protein